MTKTKKEQGNFPAPDSRMCFWYFQGETNQSPRVAIVTRVGPKDALDLTVFERGNRRAIVVDAVRHKDDSFHLQFPLHAKECGSWDYLPGQSPCVCSPPMSEFPTTKPTKQQALDK